MQPIILRIIFNILPLTIVVVAIGYTMAGEEGILNRSALKQKLFSTQDRVVQLRSDNDALRAKIRSIRDDPDAVKRLAAERLLLAEPGSTIYRFHD
jgi:cell division protein FtsB